MKRCAQRTGQELAVATRFSNRVVGVPERTLTAHGRA
jgi:hypothetical protein